ncbi:penicillin-binding transpeptidase domain-containing protein [Corynebacterium minutissimum]|uniref:Penicillin-binding protein 2 n=1 Tax=Corynebacterium minutissimum TaxID=38301 RepID=A0A2X4RCT7_9CORY|nr:penicillin-binding protein 2 [Corynebacterium minutissimum]KHO30469.1 penicillin-binding protein [Corynebacterium minutissimum]MCG7228546.1 penicillin-binding protein 2 [Corynebacterium minutissimum]MCG7237663.1 penicillin-binding protein 2 [Corynebacterium minutissimum]QPS60024.1 penicillin-binding protein 2 [Corynebacterium minutissimum]QQA79186.1 penicillin-binding protein 2 [Corynebacterium minutissimum]
MNRSIRLVSLFALLLTAVLLVNLTVVQAFSTDKYAHNPKNVRGYLEMRTTPRGQIFAGDTVLAQSTADENGNYSRSYPTDSPAFADITGYLSERFGASQLEASQNDILNGKDDSLLAHNWLDMLSGKPQKGANVEVTIDPALQQAAYDQLAGPGYKGAAVAIQPSTGKVLAMASSPSFNVSDLVGSNAAETWDQLQNQEGNPLINHATQETLPPGSIFKIITTAAGLNNGFNPNSTLTGAASITLPDTVTELTNYGNQACGGADSVTLLTAFALSCNTAFVEMSEGIGADELRKYAEGFGVGEKYSLGVETSSGALGELSDGAQVAQSAIGQRDVTMSALQAAVMAATVANKGKRMEPYLINRITDAQMNELRTTQPRQAAEAIDEDTAHTLTDLMFASERSTWGYDGNGFASKTGTAEHGEGLAPHVWYVAFDPEKDIAVGVVVKDGGNLGEGATGGQVSGPIGRAILRAYGGEQ